MPKKLPQNVVMNNENDQKYYDALCEIEDFDINDVRTLKNVVTLTGNGMVKVPFYDPDMAKMSITEPKPDQDPNTWQPPHGPLLKNRLPKYIADNNLYFYRDGESVPRHIEFTTDESGKVTARVARQNVEQAQPQRPEKPGFWHWLGNKIFGLYKDEFAEYDRKLGNYEQQCRAKEYFTADKERKAAEIATEKELEEVQEKVQRREEYGRNFGKVYGPEVKPLDNNSDLQLGSETNYRVPQGFTPEMTSNLVRIDLASDQIAPHNHADIDDPMYHKTVGVIHGSEDVMAARNGVHLKLRDTIRLARQDVKNVLEQYEQNKDPEPIGKIIGENMKYFANESTQGKDGISDKLANSMRGNVEILNLLETHPDIYKSALKNGLSKETVRTLQAQRNLVNIYDKNLEARQALLSGQAQRDPQLLRECMADIMMYNVTSKMIQKRANELEDISTEKYAPEYEERLKKSRDGGKEAANIVTMKCMNDKLTTEAPDWYKGLSDTAMVDVLRGKLKSTAKFNDLCTSAKTDGIAKTLNNKAKINSVAGELMTKTFEQQPTGNAPEDAPAKVNVVQQNKPQLGGQDGPQVGGN